jgi:hypothetical protein
VNSGAQIDKIDQVRIIRVLAAEVGDLAIFRSSKFLNHLFDPLERAPIGPGILADNASKIRVLRAGDTRPGGVWPLLGSPGYSVYA